MRWFKANTAASRRHEAVRQCHCAGITLAAQRVLPPVEPDGMRALVKREVARVSEIMLMAPAHGNEFTLLILPLFKDANMICTSQFNLARGFRLLNHARYTVRCSESISFVCSGFTSRGGWQASSSDIFRMTTRRLSSDLHKLFTV